MARQRRRKGVEHKQAMREKGTHAYHKQEAARKLRAALARQQWQLQAMEKERAHMKRLIELTRSKQDDAAADSPVPSTEESASNSGDSLPDEA